MPTQISIPQVAPIKCELPDDPRANMPPPEAFTGGIWIHRETGQPYVLAVHDPDVYFRTHTLKNSAYTWQGNEAEFITAFAKQ